MTRKRPPPKKPKKKKTFRTRLFLFCLFAVVIGIAGYYFLSLPIWQIKEVSVLGASMLSAEEIKEVSAIPLSDNLFFTSFAKARSNLREIAAIKNFHLYRIPPGTVLIKIEERRPNVVLVTQGQSMLVDQDGYIVNRNQNLTFNLPNFADLPVATGLSSSDVINEERISPPIAVVIENVIQELANIFGARRIHLELGGMQNIELLLDDILKVKLGRGEDIALKMAVFKQLLPEINDKWSQVEYVDVRFPSNPVIKFR
jgi:cell division septal protein FtsQ